MDKVLEKQDLQKLTQADTNTLKYPASLAEMEPVIDTFPQRKLQALRCPWQTFL